MNCKCHCGCVISGLTRVCRYCQIGLCIGAPPKPRKKRTKKVQPSVVGAPAGR